MRWQVTEGVVTTCLKRLYEESEELDQASPPSLVPNSEDKERSGATGARWVALVRAYVGRFGARGRPWVGPALWAVCGLAMMEPSSVGSYKRVAGDEAYESS